MPFSLKIRIEDYVNSQLNDDDAERVRQYVIDTADNLHRWVDLVTRNGLVLHTIIHTTGSKESSVMNERMVHGYRFYTSTAHTDIFSRMQSLHTAHTKR